MAKKAKAAKKPKQTKGKGGGSRAKSAPKAGGISFNQAAAQSFIDRIESLNGDLATERGEYMARCKSVREDVKSVFDEAKAAGFNVKSLKAVIETRVLEVRAEKVRDDLPTEEQNYFDQIRQAIGDLEGTPLGDFGERQAANDLARTTAQDPAALDSLAKRAEGGVEQPSQPH